MKIMNWALNQCEFGIFLPENLKCSLNGEQMDNKRKRERVHIVIREEKCEGEQSNFSFRGSKTYETTCNDPFFLFGNDEIEMVFD